jgi:hypothetical protein
MRRRLNQIARCVNSAGGSALVSVRNILKNIRTNWRTHLLCSALFALITVPLGLALRYHWLHQYDASKPHVPELKSMADQTPVYPGFQRIDDEHIFLTKDTVSLQRSFRTNAQSADIRRFYDSAFLQNGWEPFAAGSRINGEPHVVMYNRDAYQICVVHRMSAPDIYDIWYLWAAK